MVAVVTINALMDQGILRAVESRSAVNEPLVLRT